MKVAMALIALGFFGGVTASCSDDGTTGTGTTVPGTTVPGTTVPGTTVPGTTVPGTTVPGTTVPGTTVPGTTTSDSITSTTEACERPSGTDPVEVDWPLKLSAIFGESIRTGSHPCFERVVIEFGGTGDFPGYAVRYEDDPLTLGSSGEPVEIGGDANLVIFVGSWMGNEPDLYPGPNRIFPTNVSLIEELSLLDNFESVMIWGIGLDKVRPFRVFTLPDPARLVVDISNE